MTREEKLRIAPVQRRPGVRHRRQCAQGRPQRGAEHEGSRFGFREVGDHRVHRAEGALDRQRRARSQGRESDAPALGRR